MRNSVLILGVLIFLVVFSCGEKNQAPIAEITSALDSGIVKFSVEATGATSFEWDFGDGSAHSTMEDPDHIFPEYGKTYSVTLKISGPGGTTICTHEVVIPPATMMQSLTGGYLHGGNKKWRISNASKIYVLKPDNSFSVIEEWPADKLTAMGFSNIHHDEYQFFENGDFIIIPKTNNIMAGLQYCLSKSIQNNTPSEMARGDGFTLITSYIPPAGLSYALNESKDLILATVENQQSKNSTFCDVSTLSFSRGGFLGFIDWESECIVNEISEREMVITVFFSDIPSGEPLRGRITKAFKIRFEAVI